MTTIGEIGRKRRIAGAAQAFLWLGLPFVSVGGESALRLDVPGGRLLAFGAAFRVDELFVVLAATFVLLAAFLLVTLVFGRVWCGWSCPQTVLGDLTAWAAARLAPSKRRTRRRDAALAVAVLAVVSTLFSASVLWYFVPPLELFSRLAGGTLGPVLSGMWALLGGLLFLDLAAVRARFCATVCPYAKLQGVLFDRHTLVVAYDTRRAADCVDCKACVRVCPTGIDIRDGLQAECLACGACVDACTPIMAKLGRAPRLVGWFFGDPGTPRRLLRPASAVLAVVLAASVALLAGFVAARPAIGLGAIALDAFAPRRTADGHAVNAYVVTLENHGRAPADVALALRVGDGAAALRPDRVALRPGERRQVRVIATAPAGGRSGPVPAALVASSADPSHADAVETRAEVALSFFVPEAP